MASWTRRADQRRTGFSPFPPRPCWTSPPLSPGGPVYLNTLPEDLADPR
ncbi:MAG: hypothetical protein V8S34_02915 [Lawsonibacter sp.]